MPPILRSLFIPAFFALVGRVDAQYWAAECGGVGLEHVVDVKTGPGDEVFAIGDFTPGATFEGQSLVSDGISDVFVVKQNASGFVQWITTAGGSGMDLGAKLATTPAGDVVVCGQFTGVADLFGTTVSANGGSTDLFVAKLSGADGSLLWLRTAGSGAYADRASGVAVAADGRVLVTGEFRGAALFDLGTFTSTLNPNTNLPGADVFVMSLAADGTPQWLKHGLAPLEDQAAEVVVDASGNAYACGLYSGTMTFDSPHPNLADNQCFVVKFDPQGNEQWFRRVGGAAFQRMADAVVDDTGSLLLCGDVQGQLTYFDGAPDVVPNTDAFAYFLVRCALDGEFVAGTAIGSDNAVSAAAMDVQGASINIQGSFLCRFKDLADHYGATGLFIANGTNDLFIARHQTSSLALDLAQQFGGHQSKTAGGIASLNDGSLIFGGGFEHQLVFPSDGGTWGDPVFPCSPIQCLYISSCDDPNYHKYVWLDSEGLADGFIARGFVEDRQPYDNWCRQLGCDRQAQDVRVGSYAEPLGDSSVVCGGDTLFWVHSIPRYQPNSGCPAENTISWDMDVLWSTGASSDTIIVLSTGWYWCTHTASNGCYSVTDSFHVTVLPAPLAWVRIGDFDDPVAQIPPLGCFHMGECAPLWLSAVDVPLGATFQWFDNNVPVPGDSVFTDHSGLYTLVVESPNGCRASTTVCFTLLATQELPNITALEVEHFYQGISLDVQDTVAYCAGLCLEGTMQQTWYVNGQPTVLTQPFYLRYTTEEGCYDYQTWADVMLNWSLDAQTEGWYAINTHLVMYVEGCTNDSLVFDLSDSLYVIPITPPQMAEPTTAYMCPGDTVVLLLDCTNCQQVEWSGPGVLDTTDEGDTAWVNMPGTYFAVALNTELGIYCAATEYFPVLLASPPPLLIEPVTGTICLGDSALILTPMEAVSYAWTGPSGPLSANNDSVYVTELGSYYLTITTSTGCQLTNGPVNVVQYASPVISTLPDAVICPGEYVVLQLTGGNVTQFTWGPPLVPDAFTQLVYDGGTYTCQVISCGAPYDLEVEVTAGYAHADLASGPFSLCGGDSLVLDGPAGAFTYVWTPGGANTEDLLVTSVDSYQLQVIDSLGCTDISDVVVVTGPSFTSELVVVTDTVCEGADALLSATGSGTLTWYADPGLAEELGTGATLLVADVVTPDTVYITQNENGCASQPMPVSIGVQPLPAAPMITGDTSLCLGAALTLEVPVIPGVSYVWTTPNSQVPGTSVFLASISNDDVGIYSTVATVAGCTGPPASVLVVAVEGPPAPVITGDTTLCVGDDLLLTVEEVTGATYEWITPVGTGDASQYTVPDIALSDFGTYTCQVVLNGCTSGLAEVLVVIDPLPGTPTIQGPDTLCEGEPGEITAFGMVPGAFQWSTPQGLQPGTEDHLAIPGTLVGESVQYGVIVEGGSCADAAAYITIAVDACADPIPNVFTPNGDGQNDQVSIDDAPGTTYGFTVFNRWGNKVFTAAGRTIRWNGRDDGGSSLPEGVYFYVLERTRNNTARSFSGYIQLLREH